MCIGLFAFFPIACAQKVSAPGRATPSFNVDEIALHPAGFAKRRIRVEGFLGWRGEYVDMTDDGRPGCRSGGAEERILIIKGISEKELKRLGLAPFAPGRHVIVEGIFTNSVQPLPRLANNVSTEEWDAPFGPLVSSRIVTVFDERCQKNASTN